MNKLKAILFDCDGVLRDSRAAIYTATEHAFVEHDLPAPTKDELQPHIHHHSFVHEALAGDISFESFETSYRSKVDALLTEVTLLPYAQETLAQLGRQGYKIGLVTAALRIHEYLRRVQIEQYFDIIVSGDDITRHKPDPEGIEQALERLSISADEAVYIGDMPTDIYAARAAKLRAAIGVPTGFANQRELQTAEADYIIDSLKELPDLIARLEQ